MLNGVIKNLRLENGFGFISPEQGGNDVFFHASDLVDAKFDELTPGLAVTFEMGESAKGPKAVKVTLV